MNWWELPGPNKFVQGVADDLRDGMNVIVCCPAYTPAGFRQSLLQEFGKVEFHVLRTGSERPLDILFRRLVPDAEAGCFRDVASFIERVEARNRIVWVEDISAAIWSAWDAFLREYQHSCGEVSLLQRTQFCVVPPAESCSFTSNGEVRLGVHRYDGVATALDALIYSSLTFSGSWASSIEHDVAVSTIAGIALWDPAVTEQLSSESLKVILEPSSVLKKIASDRSWDGTPSWPRGSSMRFGNRDLVHSSFLPPGSSEVTRRIWSAEVGVILPKIEELRQDLLERYSGELRIPYRTRFGQLIEDACDLEIGHICDQLQTINAPRRDRFAAEHLTKMRNRLAHLQTLDETTVLGLGTVASESAAAQPSKWTSGHGNHCGLKCTR